MAINNPFSKRLKQAREKKGISQKNLGIKIGIEPSSASGRMNHYEKGRHLPDFDTLKKIAEELEVPVPYLFCESDSTADLIVLIDKLSEEEKFKLDKELKNKIVPDVLT